MGGSGYWLKGGSTCSGKHHRLYLQTVHPNSKKKLMGWRIIYNHGGRWKSVRERLNASSLPVVDTYEAVIPAPIPIQALLLARSLVIWWHKRFPIQFCMPFLVLVRVLLIKEWCMSHLCRKARSRPQNVEGQHYSYFKRFAYTNSNYRTLYNTCSLLRSHDRLITLSYRIYAIRNYDELYSPIALDSSNGRWLYTF